MKIRNYLMAFAAATLATAPALAAPVNPASSLSLSNATRTTTAPAKKNQLAGAGLLIGIFATVAVVVGIVVVADNSDSN